MKIRGTYSGFSTTMNIGHNSFFVDLDTNGVDLSLKEFIDNAVNFNYIIIRNIDRDDVKELNFLIKKLLAASLKLKIELNIDGTFTPPNAGVYERVIYNTYINSEIFYEKKTIKWLKDVGANFIFTLTKEEDLNDINSFVRQYEIDKNKIFLKMEMVDERTLSLIKICGYNITFDMNNIIGDICVA